MVGNYFAKYIDNEERQSRINLSDHITRHVTLSQPAAEAINHFLFELNSGPLLPIFLFRCCTSCNKYVKLHDIFDNPCTTRPPVKSSKPPVSVRFCTRPVCDWCSPRCSLRCSLDVRADHFLAQPLNLSNHRPNSSKYFQIVLRFFSSSPSPNSISVAMCVLLLFICFQARMV